MKAVVVARPGGPEQLAVKAVPDPVPDDHEVLIQVAATAVNRADTRQRQGLYPPPAGASPYLGLECAGVVVQVGSSVSKWHPGDRVCALLTGGGYAQLVAVPAGQVLPIPAGLDLIHAAALPEVTCTVRSTLFGWTGGQPGDTVLIHGGASGIGTMAIQLSRAAGFRVACTASRPKLDRCRELGAEITIDYAAEDFVEVLREATSGRGIDVVLDVVGADYLERNLEILAPYGRLLIVGVQSGTTAALDLGALLTKRLVVTGSTLRSRSLDEKARIVRDVETEVWPLVEQGLVQPVVDRVLPLSEVAEAHRVVERSEHVGKVVIAVDG